MNQLTQKLKSGEMTIQEVPMPIVGPGMVLVRNHYSLISAGTEGSTVKTARKSMIGKAKERPQQVKQVIDVLKKQGPVQTYRVVMKKLDAYSPLGYSSAGVVIDVGEGVKGFAVGDKVACAGAGYANHAEVVAVPENLCVKLNDDVDLKSASYNTLGAIALQGIRQADLRLGESCAVIGLGLIGQLTCLMLRASGVKTFGIDIDGSAVETAKKHCADVAFVRSEQGVADQIGTLTNGIGTDAVIITAATASLDPINFAGRIVRKKGRVVVVGAVPTGFDREPDYYKKELEVRMSCSYGPGRYDLNYEEKGIDYPAAYVRWTEKRNMIAFQELVHSGRIDIDYLTTHIFDLDDAPNAYNMILEKKEPFLGILLKYDTAKQVSREKIVVKNTGSSGKVVIGFVGAGSYAQSNLLPNIPKNNSEVVFKGVMTASGTTSKRVAGKFGFSFCTSNEKDILDSEAINTVFIATRHDSHAKYVIEALKKGKHVYVEKPLCITNDELNEITKAYNESRITNNVTLMVGYNRRFSPLTKILQEQLPSGPKSILYRVNAGSIPLDSWIQDPDIGGGRIIGEVCHFIDYLMFLTASLPVSVYAVAMRDAQGLYDTVNVNLSFENGSSGSIAYFANGSKALPKEYVEVYASGTTAILNDFKSLEIYSNKRILKKKLMSQDKGQKNSVREFLKNVKEGGPPLISFEELYAVTTTTFLAVKSLKEGKAFRIERHKESSSRES